MEVKLAGFNVDTNVLGEMEKITGKRDDLTPEILSASYARISRDSRPIGELRIDSKQKVEKARSSNSSIIFKMGHHSVAEHSVFNFDIVGLSRYAVEELEKFRLCSYTEKSQRYITLDGDFVIPEEIKGSPFEQKFVDIIEIQNKFYDELYVALKKYVFEKNPEIATILKNHNLLEGWAKEDARYIVGIATEAQIGMTVNARNLELMLRRFASHPLLEIQDLGRALFHEVETVAPSIILFHEGNEYDINTYPRLRELGIKLFNGHHISEYNVPVTLIKSTDDADEVIATSLLYKGLGLCYDDVEACVEDLEDPELTEIFKAAWKDAQLYDSMLREFEYVNLTYEIVLSSSCFGQLKRHRMSSIITQPYDPNLDITIPQSITDAHMDNNFREIVEKTNKVYYELYKEVPYVAPYVLTNSHRRRILVRVNARELYHMSRLREDHHAQWDVKNTVMSMCKLAKKEMAFVFKLLCGKDKYNDTYFDIFKEKPIVKNVTLPSIRRIMK